MEIAVLAAVVAMVASAAAALQVGLRERPQTARTAGWAGGAVILAVPILAFLADGGDSIATALAVIGALLALTGWALGTVLGTVAAQLLGGR